GRGCPAPAWLAPWSRWVRFIPTIDGTPNAASRPNRTRTIASSTSENPDEECLKLEPPSTRKGEVRDAKWARYNEALAIDGPRACTIASGEAPERAYRAMDHALRVRANSRTQGRLPAGASGNRAMCIRIPELLRVAARDAGRLAQGRGRRTRRGSGAAPPPASRHRDCGRVGSRSTHRSLAPLRSHFT